MSDEALSEEDAAQFLGVSKSFLAKRRCYGDDGPPYVKYGGKRVVYLRADLEQWRAAHRRIATEGSVGQAPFEANAA
jgi:predicted DNA-binding transcriptional regulator AlpA